MGLVKKKAFTMVPASVVRVERNREEGRGGVERRVVAGQEGEEKDGERVDGSKQEGEEGEDEEEDEEREPHIWTRVLLRLAKARAVVETSANSP